MRGYYFVIEIKGHDVMTAMKKEKERKNKS